MDLKVDRSWHERRNHLVDDLKGVCDPRIRRCSMRRIRRAAEGTGWGWSSAWARAPAGAPVRARQQEASHAQLRERVKPLALGVLIRPGMRNFNAQLPQWTGIEKIGSPPRHRSGIQVVVGLEENVEQALSRRVRVPYDLV